MYPTGVHVHNLRNAVAKRTVGFMIPSQMASLTQFFCARTLLSFSFGERTCVAIFFLRWPTEHVTSKFYTGQKPRTTKKKSKTN